MLKLRATDSLSQLVMSVMNWTNRETLAGCSLKQDRSFMSLAGSPNGLLNLSRAIHNRTKWLVQETKGKTIILLNDNCLQGCFVGYAGHIKNGDPVYFTVIITPVNSNFQNMCRTPQLIIGQLKCVHAVVNPSPNALSLCVSPTPKKSTSVRQKKAEKADLLF